MNDMDDNMNEPKLSTRRIGKGKWAEQVGRGVNLIDDEGRIVSRLNLDRNERDIFDRFVLRVQDAWMEYDERSQNGNSAS